MDFPIIDSTLCEYILEKYLAVWRKPLDTHKGQNPAPNPVSFVPYHVDILKGTKYGVGEKTDGNRMCFFMCLDQDDNPINVFINRRCEMFSVRCAVQKDYYRDIGTLLDGELVGDTYVVFDVVAFKGTSLMDEPSYIGRLSHAKECVVGRKTYPKSEKTTLAEAKKGSIVFMKPRIKLQVKHIYALENIASIASEVRTHGSDGVIFTPLEQPIQLELHEGMIKWKEHHPLDFKLSIRSVGGGDAKVAIELLYHSHDDDIDICRGVSFSGYNFSVKVQDNDVLQKCLYSLTKDKVTKASMIVECECVPDFKEETLVIQLVRRRNDKSTSNSAETLRRTFDSIQNQVDWDTLVSMLSEGEQGDPMI